MAAPRALLASAAVLLGGCASLGSRTASVSPADVSRYARLLRAEDGRQYDAALVDTALSSTWSPLRRQAALAAGRIGDRARAGRLIALLQDPDTAVAANAAFSLGLLHDSTATGPLVAAMRRGGGVGRAAAWSLGELGQAAAGVIEQSLRAGGLDRWTDAELVIAASRLRPAPAALLERLGKTPADPRAAWAATYAAARAGLPAGIRTSLALANHADADVRMNVARVLRRQITGDSLADAARAALATLVGDRDPRVRINAIRSMASFGAPGRSAIIAATHDRDANVRVQAAQLVSGIAGDDPLWAALFDSDTSFTYRRYLLASRGAVGGGELEISKWASSNDWRARAAAVDALTASSDATTWWPIVLRLIHDSDGRVRANAIGAVASRVDSASTPWARDTLLAALRDGDVITRAIALGALSRRARAAEVPEVLRAYSMAAGDSDNDVRAGAIAYLASAWKKDSARFSPSSISAIRALPAPADPLVRAEAKDVSIFAWPTAPHGTTRPLEWYEGIVRSIVLPSLDGRPPVANIETDRGTVSVELLGIDAALTVNNFLTLARSGYYRGLRFHRVVPNFVAQDGDPRGDGSGGPGYAIRDELNRRPYDRGAVGMALSGPDTGGSQYFLTLSPQPHLDGRYTVFGRVVAGYPALDAIVQGDRIVDIRQR